ncbi:unnamed protein product [Polarella glacialis]|uniref:ISXO2-like transposase domain-containing protein n=1 Tax=Polarella glacialis TaxID=89957 RepID=A0A813FIF5_POLGL|nr:unnamed protein product [Polarella glacialis]
MPLTIGYEGTDDDTLFKMIRPAFAKKMLDPDIEALLRRCLVIVNTNWWLYIRPAGTKGEVTITRTEMKTKKNITPQAVQTLKERSKNEVYPDQATFDRQVAEEQTLFRKKLRPDLSTNIKQEELDTFYDNMKKLAYESEDHPINVEVVQLESQVDVDDNMVEGAPRQKHGLDDSDESPMMPSDDEDHGVMEDMPCDDEVNARKDPTILSDLAALGAQSKDVRVKGFVSWAYAMLDMNRNKLANVKIETREDFLYNVKHARIKNTQPYPDVPSLLALIFAQVIGMVNTTKVCAACNCHFLPKFKRSQWLWRSRTNCSECQDGSFAICSNTALDGAQTQMWVEFLDVKVMWVFDYPRLIILRESRRSHQTIDPWISYFQQVATFWITSYMSTHGLLDKACRRGATKVNKKRKNQKKKGKNAKTKAAAMKRRQPIKPIKHQRPLIQKQLDKFKLVVQVDESYLNKKKPGKLSKHGHVEMLTNLHLLNLPKKTIIVSDSWSATISSVKAFRIQKKKWNRFDFHHELVNHNAGEIVNPRGFTTNGIEAVWSVLKRWARKRQGGRMPSHSDRVAWTALINEYQFRKVASRGETLDNGNAYYLPFAKFV